MVFVLLWTREGVLRPARSKRRTPDAAIRMVRTCFVVMIRGVYLLIEAVSQGKVRPSYVSQ